MYDAIDPWGKRITLECKTIEAVQEWCDEEVQSESDYCGEHVTQDYTIIKITDYDNDLFEEVGKYTAYSDGSSNWVGGQEDVPR